MKTRILKSIIPALSLMLVLLASCNSNQDQYSRIRLSLTDAPSTVYSAVNLDVKGVQVGVDSNWTSLNLLHPGVYNLLDYRNGKTILLADEDIPAGKISQIRLILGDNNTVVKDGVSYALTTPSGQQSGIKLNLHQTLMPDMKYSFVIDFDAARSVVETGSGKFNLKPVIRIYAEAYGGTIKGFALPMDAKAQVKAIQGTDTLLSLPEADGKFLFPGLKAGNWDIKVYADPVTGYKDTQVLAVPVVAGQVKDLGTITLVK